VVIFLEDRPSIRRENIGNVNLQAGALFTNGALIVLTKYIIECLGHKLLEAAALLAGAKMHGE